MKSSANAGTHAGASACIRNARQTPRLAAPLPGIATLVLLLSLAGCASPGSPRPPSLNLPKPVADLTAQRLGDTVQLRFTAPSRSADNLPLHGVSVQGSFCREAVPHTCTPGPGLAVALTGTAGGRNSVLWQDTLPSELTHGAPRPLLYRVEFFSKDGRSAGRSEPAYTLAGEAPPTVTGLTAQGSRLGIVLHWTPAPQLTSQPTSQPSSELLLMRTDLTHSTTAPVAVNRNSNAASSGANREKHAHPGEVLLAANAAEGTSTLDASAKPETPYSYTALRSRKLRIGGRTLELRSALSPAINFTLHAIYPPPPPTALTLAAFHAEGPPPAFLVDLIWQPIDQAGLIAPLAGYNIYREDTSGQTPSAAAGSTAMGSTAMGSATMRSTAMDSATTGSATTGQKLNTIPILLPAFQDTTAIPSHSYCYRVTAVDTQGNESPATTTPLTPTP